jgi:hypothetical protein
MYINKKRKKPDTRNETIWETEHRLKKKAIEIAKHFKDTKPIKYLLK